MNQLSIVAALLLCALGCSGCGPAAVQIRGMTDWSAAARKSCRTPGQCPEAEACIRGVLAASEPGSGRSEYNRAKTLCWPYGGAQ